MKWFPILTCAAALLATWPSGAATTEAKGPAKTAARPSTAVAGPRDAGGAARDGRAAKPATGPAKTRSKRLLVPPPAAAQFPPAPAITARGAKPGTPAFHAGTLSAGLPNGQRLVQLLEADLDRDGKPEWIAIGEPDGAAEGVSIAIFSAPAGKAPPQLRFAQVLQERGIRVAGAEVMEVRPLGMAVVLVGADPSVGGDSRFVVDIFGWNGTIFRPMVPETALFRSQGGFSIEPGAMPYPYDELVVWSYVNGDDEQLYDRHQYEYRRWRWDGVRFKAETLETVTPEKIASPEEAGIAAGAKRPDLRRRIVRVAEVP
ncbi:MAG TPA: hypothetical protein VGD74_08200 [Vulgatibacter sp.]